MSSSCLLQDCSSIAVLGLWCRIFSFNDAPDLGLFSMLLLMHTVVFPEGKRGVYVAQTPGYMRMPFQRCELSTPQALMQPVPTDMQACYGTSIYSGDVNSQDTSGWGGHNLCSLLITCLPDHHWPATQYEGKYFPVCVQADLNTTHAVAAAAAAGLLPSHGLRHLYWCTGYSPSVSSSLWTQRWEVTDSTSCCHLNHFHPGKEKGKTRQERARMDDEREPLYAHIL